MTTCCIFQCIVLTERGFSHINFNLCKSDLHNRLSVEHTSQLMTVKLSGLIFMSLTSNPVFQNQWKHIRNYATKSNSLHTVCSLRSENMKYTL